jgi:beta-lactamase class A
VAGDRCASHDPGRLCKRGASAPDGQEGCRVDEPPHGHGRKRFGVAGNLGIAVSLLATLSLPATSAWPAATAYASAAGTSPAAAICTSATHPALASRLSRDILAALRHRSSTVALTVDDRKKGVLCALSQHRHFDSASVVKVTILGALLREAMEQHRYLTGTEVTLTTAMITRSDNSAASALWARVGMRRLQHFLNLAKMSETELGQNGFWGLTQITAHDEMALLRLLTSKNTVLDAASRAYALDLMAHVIPSQRWGVPVGAPAGVTVHVKNGWVPIAPHGWRINSIGSFSGRGRDYLIAVLTQGNPTMAYGVRTIEDAAEVIHRDLNAGAAAAIPPSEIPPSAQTPDEWLPALPETQQAR